MVFSSLVFLCAFLPAVLAGHFALPRVARNAWLLIVSLLFYFWGEKHFVLLMVGSIIANWALALWLDRMRDRPRIAKAILALGIFTNLLALGVFKYANLFADAIGARLDPMHLPIGISFFTFQAMSYLIDVHRQREPAEANPLRVGLFISLFPQLIAGPIVRYSEIAAQIRQRTLALDDVVTGFQRFMVGLAKKVLIANSVGEVADLVFALPADNLTASAAWLGALAYALQIYFDFSGYSDMAIGLARVFGFKIPENFNYPYVAQSITEFWRRWHMSLSRWFRDYLYIPLGGNRRGSVRTYFNLWAVFLLCGFWHGAAWNFVAWGALHGTFLVVERVRRPNKTNTTPRPLPHRVLAHGYTLLAITLAWVLFRAEDTTTALQMYRAMLGLGQAVTDPNTWVASDILDNNKWAVALAVGAIGATPIGPRAVSLLRNHRGWPWVDLAGTAAMLLLTAFCVSALTAGTHNPFIYYRF